MSIPKWLQIHLEAKGLWDQDGVSRAARARRCKGCRRYVLVGLDGDRCALPVAVDPEPLSALGEAAALLTGRTTYRLAFLSSRLELDARDRYQIRGDAAGRTGPQHDVLAAHACGTTPLPEADHRLGAPSALTFDAPARRLVEPPF